MVEDRKTAIFYTTAVCNLKCKYCVIDKNPALKKIDDMLDESFKGDYYYNFTRELFPDVNQLEEVEIWGGEPYLGMHRIYYTLEKLIATYPNLHRVFGSTNLLAPNFIEEFKGLLKVLGTADHPMTMSLQLSLDGTQEITDLNRGEGVTKRFSERMIEMTKAIPGSIPDNVTIEMGFKPTLDIYSLHLLNSKEKIIEYFEFFEQFYTLYDKLSCPQMTLRPSLPNFAMPTDFTQEDGKYFAEFCKWTREIEQEHKFRYYTNITLFSHDNRDTLHNCLDGCLGLCGTGRQNVGMLPNRMVSMCHMAFVDLVGDYKKAMVENTKRVTSVDENMFTNYYANNFCFPVEKLDEYEKMIADFHCPNTKAKASTLVDEIVMLAYAGQIQSKYKNKELAIKAAQFMLTHMAYCVKDNLGVTGSIYSLPTGTIKVFLNGAEDYILRGEIK